MVEAHSANRGQADPDRREGERATDRTCSMGRNGRCLGSAFHMARCFSLKLPGRVAVDLRLVTPGQEGAAEPSTDRLKIQPVSATSDEKLTSRSLGRHSSLQTRNRHLLRHFT